MDEVGEWVHGRSTCGLQALVSLKLVVPSCHRPPDGGVTPICPVPSVPIGTSAKSHRRQTTKAKCQRRILVSRRANERAKVRRCLWQMRSPQHCTDIFLHCHVRPVGCSRIIKRAIGGKKESRVTITQRPDSLDSSLEPRSRRILGLLRRHAARRKPAPGFTTRGRGGHLSAGTQRAQRV